MFPRSQIASSTPDAPAQGFAGRLPGVGSLSSNVQNRSWHVKPGETGWQGSTGTQAGIYGTGGVFYDRNVDDEIRAGSMPASINDGRGGLIHYLDNPVGYVRAAGLAPRGDADVAALQKYPELALHALAETAKANGMVRNSTSQIVGTSISVSGGSNRPADCKCSLTFVPNAAVQASLTRSF